MSGSFDSGAFDSGAFDTGASGVIANITSAQAAAQAGTLAATGEASAALSGAQAATQSGIFSASGSALASLSGAEVVAQAGQIGGQPTPDTGQRFGGGRKKWRRPAMAAAIPSLYIPPEIPLPVPATARVQSAAAFTTSGKLFARGHHSAKAKISGATSSGAAMGIKAVGQAKIMIKAAVVGAYGNTAAIQGAQAVSNLSQVKAKGLGFSDAELIALADLLAEAA